jgi:crossover junction endodeoxyribonuclease RuvC
MIVLGIDPGASGAFAWVSGDGHLIEVADMPTVTVRGKTRVSAPGVVTLLKDRPVDLVVIEGVNAMPRQGVSSTFIFGYAAGLLEGAVAACEYPLEIVRSAEWKRLARVPADKGACREMAMRMWPGGAHWFKRVKDDGRADAALMARWAALRGK